MPYRSQHFVYQLSLGCSATFAGFRGFHAFCRRCANLVRILLWNILQRRWAKRIWWNQVSLAFNNFSRKVAAKWHDDFCWAGSFDPAFLAAMMYEGYLPTAHGPLSASSNGLGKYVVLPKLHVQRCVIMFEQLKVQHIHQEWRERWSVSLSIQFSSRTIQTTSMFS